MSSLRFFLLIPHSEFSLVNSRMSQCPGWEPIDHMKKSISLSGSLNTSFQLQIYFKHKRKWEKFTFWFNIYRLIIRYSFVSFRISLLFISYHASISDVDVMWRPGMVIGLSNLIGGLVSTITGSEVWTVVLLAKSIAEIIRIWYYYNLYRYAVLYYWMRIVSALSIIKYQDLNVLNQRELN